MSARYALRLASEKGQPVERDLLIRRNGTHVEPGVNWQQPQSWALRETAERHAAEKSTPATYVYEVVEVTSGESWEIVR